MQKRKFVKTKKYMATESLMTSFQPLCRNGWLIKLSVLDTEKTLVVVMSMFTHQTIIRYFTNEIEAVHFINFILESDSSVKIPSYSLPH